MEQGQFQEHERGGLITNGNSLFGAGFKVPVVLRIRTARRRGGPCRIETVATSNGLRSRDAIVSDGGGLFHKRYNHEKTPYIMAIEKYGKEVLTKLLRREPAVLRCSGRKTNKR